MPEIITFGEAMLRLCPPDHLRIEQADRFNVQIGGAELNTGVGLAQLGRSVGWVSRLPNNPLGRLIVGRIRETGVTTDHVLFADNERLGLFFLEEGAAPRSSSIIYDRVNSACSNIRPGMVDWPNVFEGAKWFHVSGITAAISPNAAEVVLESLQAAKAAKLTVSFDPNYRSKLWSHEAAKAWYAKAIGFVDVLISSPEDAERYFEVKESDPEQSLRVLADRYYLKAAAYTFRSGESVWRDEYGAKLCCGGQVFASKTHAVDVVDRIGAGDAFAAGLIDGLLRNEPQSAVEYGAALGALKHTIPGDFVFTTRNEIEELIRGSSLRVKR